MLFMTVSFFQLYQRPLTLVWDVSCFFFLGVYTYSSAARHTNILEMKLALQQTIDQSVSATFNFFELHYNLVSFCLFSFVYFNQPLLKRDCV